MNILYLHQYFNTPKMPGSTRSYEFAKHLVGKGHNVYMITSNWQNKSKEKFSIEDGINVFWAPIFYSNKMGFMSRIKSYLYFILYILKVGRDLNFDFIIASSTPLTIGIPALIYKKIRSVNFIFEVRDVWPQIPIDMGFLKSKFLIYLAKSLEKSIYKNSVKIIALSDGMKKEILKVIPNSNKVNVITNFSDIKSFYLGKEHGLYFKKKKLKLGKSPLIVYAGSLGRINNVNYILDIAKESNEKSSEIKFLIAGDGFQKKLILSRAKDLGLLNKNFFLFDYFSKKHLPVVLSSATIVSSFFIDLPSMRNNSANKFFDALAAGKPIMLNYGGWQSQLIKQTNAGFVIPNNDPKLAFSIIKEVVFNHQKITLMSKMSKKLSERFSLESCLNKFEKIINETIS